LHNQPAAGRVSSNGYVPAGKRCGFRQIESLARREVLELHGGDELMNQQEYTLTMEVKSNHLYVSTSGTRSKESVKAITMAVFNAALKNNLHKVLIDVRELNGMFGFLDIYYLVTEVLKDLRDKGVTQVAVIDIRRSVTPGWFLETVAQNRGFNFRVFAEDEAAVKWLGG
jgi:hypothetical protein